MTHKKGISITMSKCPFYFPATDPIALAPPISPWSVSDTFATATYVANCKPHITIRIGGIPCTLQEQDGNATFLSPRAKILGIF